MTKRKQDKEEAENDAPDNQHEDNISDVSKESTHAPREKRAKTRSNVSVTIEATTKLDKEKAQKLQRQRETLIAQGASKTKSYALRSKQRFPKALWRNWSTRLSLLNGATDEEFDMEKEQELKRFVQYLVKSEKVVLELTVYPWLV